jgi:hypothetical protein
MLDETDDPPFLLDEEPLLGFVVYVSDSELCEPDVVVWPVNVFGIIHPGWLQSPDGKFFHIADEDRAESVEQLEKRARERERAGRSP